MPQPPEPAGPPRRRRPRVRSVAGAVILAGMVASAAYAGNTFGVRDQLTPPAERLPSDRATEDTDGPATTNGDEAAAAPTRRSYPWWQEVATFDGDGSAETEAFTLRDDALQWRVTWRCDEGGALTIRRVADDGTLVDRPLAETGGCPDQGRGFAVDSETTALAVQADGPWEIAVEQQIDDPIVDEPTEAMAAGEMIATGEFYDIERRTDGHAEIYRTDDGYELRLDGPFYATPDSDVEVWVSELDEPQSTDEVADGPTTSVAFLPATSGAMNFQIPDEVDMDAVRSVIIWCEPLQLAYGAASLER